MKKWEYEWHSMGKSVVWPCRIRKNTDNVSVRENPLRDVQEWLHEFTKHFVDKSVPAQRNAPASSSRESVSESRGRVISDKHSTHTHFPKDRNYDIWVRSKITRNSLQKTHWHSRTTSRKIGDLITAERKVLWNNRRHAVVVQDLATQWIQSYPCETKTSQETAKSLQRCLEATWKPKFIHTDNSLEFGKVCEDLSWNHCTSTLHRSEIHGIAERAVRRIREGTSAVLLEQMDSSEIYSKRPNAKEVIFPKENGKFIFPAADDHQGQKFNNETRVPNPQSCAWLVIWQNLPRPKNPDQICWYQKPTRRHTDEGQFHTWWVEQSSPSVQYQCSAQLAVPKWCRKECNRKQKKRELWQTRSRRWTWPPTAPSSRVHPVARRCSEHPVNKLRIS